MWKKIQSWFNGEQLSESEIQAHMAHEILKDQELDRLVEINRSLEERIRDISRINVDLRKELERSEDLCRERLKRFQGEKKRNKGE
jgi:hypothetical protein